MNAVLTLLLHESRSISFVVTELLHGIIDPEEMAESESSFRLFMNEFWRQNGLERVGRNIVRMSSCIDKSQYTGLAQLEKINTCIEHSLFLLENILEIAPSKTSDMFSALPEFLFWLLNHASKVKAGMPGTYYQNAHLAGEILSIFCLLRPKPCSYEHGSKHFCSYGWRRKQDNIYRNSYSFEHPSILRREE